MIPQASGLHLEVSLAVRAGHLLSAVAVFVDATIKLLQEDQIAR